MGGEAADPAAASPRPAELSLGPEPLGEGSEVEFTRTKTHFRDERCVQKGQRGVIQALSGQVCAFVERIGTEFNPDFSAR